MQQQSLLLITRKALLLFLLFSFSTPLWAQNQDNSINELLNNPSRYNGKSVTVKGIVSNFKNKVSRKGNSYFTFTLRQGVSEVTVFSFGSIGLSNGEEVRVTGTFYKKRKVGKYVFYNEIDATDGSIEKLKNRNSSP